MILIKKVEKLTTDFEPTDNLDVLKKAYLDEKFKKIDGHFSYFDKDCNGFKLQYNKQTVAYNLIQRAVKTTIQTLYDKRLFDNFQQADKVLEDFLFTTRRRGDLSEEGSRSMILLKILKSYQFLSFFEVYICDTYNYM